MSALPPIPDYSDEACLRGLQRGDPAVIEYFVKTAAPRLQGFFKRWKTLSADADDLTMMCIEKVLDKADTCRGNLWPWILSIAARLAASWFRALPPHQSMEGEDLERIAAWQALRTSKSYEPDPKAEPPPEILGRLGQHLAALTERQREALELRFSTSPLRPYEEIGVLLSIPTGTARKRVFDAVEFLRNAFESEDSQ